MDGRALAARLGQVGLWSNTLERMAARLARDVVSRAEQLGFGAVWFPEALGSKEAFAHSAILLGAGERIVVGTGIANIFARDAVAMANGARALTEAYPGRFVLGLGVSHKPTVEARGGAYRKPVSSMAAYLDAMDVAPTTLAVSRDAPRMLAALGPRMLQLAGARTAGALPYFVPLEHTPIARQALGLEPCLAVELACVLETDPVIARRIGRTYTRRYLSAINYTNSLRRLGWQDADLQNEGSDRLVDALVAWGDAERVAERTREHLAAGADHVCLQVLTADWPNAPLHEYAALSRTLLR